MAIKKETSESPGLFRYLISKAFWLNILIACILIAIILWLTLIFLKQYSRHGESQTVPNLVGLSIEDAMLQLNQLELEYAVMDSTFDPDEKPLSIISQDPPPESKVKSGRKIYVTINTSNPPLIDVPAIEVGTSYVSVQEIFASKGLKVGNVSYKPFEYKDVFLDMFLEGRNEPLRSGEKIPKGSKINLVLGSGKGDTKIDLPDFRTLTFDEAKNLIQLKELNLGSVICSGSITDTANAYVYKQSPKYEPGNKINIGSMVDIWISQEEINPFETEEPE